MNPEEDNEESSSTLIKNAFFTIQGDYTRNLYNFVDSDHQFDLFNYGYVGQFNTYKTPFYQNGTAIDSSTGIIYSGRILSGWGDTLYTFNENKYTNQDLANYTNAYYQMFSDYGLTSFVGAENDGNIYQYNKNNEIHFINC